MRETVRELGERRATGFLKKFYGWYLGRGRFPTPVQGRSSCSSRRWTRSRPACWRPHPAPPRFSSELVAELPDRRTTIVLDSADLDLRRRLSGDKLSDEAGDPFGSERDQVVDPVRDRLDPCVRQRRAETLDRLGADP